MAGAGGALPEGGDVVREVPGYRIERQLGRGSMGVVYLAEDVNLRRKVALKILIPTLADDELFRKRFDRESQSAANLDHPNIVPVYAAGEAAGSLYIAMRYVGGGDLRALLEANGPLGLEQASAIITSVAEALDAAHAQGMIHRDVKPANILIDGRAGQEHYYLSDFGITKIVSSGRSLTSTGQIIGTVDYIAPEQIQGKPIDGRADLYALGCVLYQCLTGTTPFPREETAALMWAHVHDDPPAVSTRRPDLPPQIDHLIARALAKQPEDRYATCGELALALRAVTSLTSAPTSGGTLYPAELLTPPPPAPAGMTSTYTPPTPAPARAPATAAPSRRKRWLALSGVLVLVLLVGSTVGVMKYLNQRFPNQAEQTLLGQIPTALTAKNCDRDATAEQDIADVQASVICKSDGNNDVNSVVYTKFTSPKALDSRYNATVAPAGIHRDSGTCQDAENVEGTYTSETGQATGRTACYEQRGSSYVAWTDNQAHILGVATRLDTDYPKLQNWWAGVVGLPTQADLAAQALKQKQVQENQQKIDDANKNAAALQAQLEETKKQEAAKELQQQQAQIQQQTQQQQQALQQQKDQLQQQSQQQQQALQQAQQQAQQQIQQQQQALQKQQSQNGGQQNQNNSRGGGHRRGQNQDNSGQGQGDSGQNQSGGGSVTSGGQDIQQMIDEAVRQKLRQQGSTESQGLQQQTKDDIIKSLQQQGNTGGLDLSQLINDAIQQEQAGQSQR